MNKIKEIIIGTNNAGKYKEICELLPKDVIKHSPKEFDLLNPEETGKTFKENSLIKASYFSKKTNLICLADDSGFEVELLNGAPGIYSARWGGKKNNFNIAIKKIYDEMKKNKKNWKNHRKATFVCCLSIFWPDGKKYSRTGKIKGKISLKKKGNKGFGYDPIFIPSGYNQTFGEMNLKSKMTIDHRFKAYEKIKIFFD